MMPDLNTLLAAYNSAAQDKLAKNAALGNAEQGDANAKQAYLQAVQTGDQGQIYTAAVNWLTANATLSGAQSAYRSSSANYVTATQNLLIGIRNALP